MREDWIECKVESISEYLRGITYKKENASDKELSGMFPILRANNIKDDKINFDELVFVDKHLINYNQILRKNDILFAMSSGSIHLVGKSAFITDDLQFSFGAFCGVLRPNSYINAKYLSSYFSSLGFKNYISTVAKGSNINNLKREHLLNIQLPLPPLPEQRAIVKKLESLFSSLDAGVADLKKAQQQLKIYRQAVLKKAFEGELTKEWREKHSYNMDDFLQELKNKKNTAIKEKLISKGDYFPNYKLEQLNFTTPNCWLSLPWKTLTSNRKYALKRGPFGSALKKDFFVESGTVVYEQGHAINDDPYRHRYFITPEKFEELKAFAVGAGDLIISCSGATLGRICLLPEDAEVGVINQALLKVDLDEEVILKKYFLILFRSESFQRLIFSKALGSAMPNMVGMEELKEMPIPIPSILEQKEIVKQIESRLSVCDSIEQNIKESLVKAEALRQSILKKAFEGNLLTAKELAECKLAKDYEPASVLLERINADKIKK